MTNLVEILKKLLRDVTLFVRYASGLKRWRERSCIPWCTVKG